MTNTQLRIILIALIEAIQRKGTERDGNWGYPAFHEQLDMLLNALRSSGDPRES